MELNVFSLCTYGQLATNLGKRDRTLNHPTNTKTSLKHNCILNLYSRSHCGEDREAALPCKFIVKTKTIIKKTMG